MHESQTRQCGTHVVEALLSEWDGSLSCSHGGSGQSRDGDGHLGASGHDVRAEVLQAGDNEELNEEKTTTM